MATAQLEVRELKKYFPISKGIIFKRAEKWIKAVDGVNFSLQRGETLGIVGESGSGKTTIAKLLLLLDQPTSGQILFNGKNVYDLRGEKLRLYRRSIQPVFQDPSSSLSPRLRVGKIISEPIEVGSRFSKEEIQQKVAESLSLVGLPQNSANLFPNEFSGGQMQRIAIARALCSNPDIIILDEPISSLDVSIRAQIINLLKNLQEKLKHSYILIGHDLAVAAYMCTYIAVMYLGRIVELAPVDNVCARPLHPYSQGLFSAALPHHPRDKGGEVLVTGEIPSPLEPPAGCPFHPRCNRAKSRCSEDEPALRQVAPMHFVACHPPLQEKNP
jgi:oligopeptide/dipeptide ABC transporter ATP-binding protein